MNPLPEPAYVLADSHGVCVDATDAALELIGTNRDTLRLLRVGDLSKPDTPDSLTRQLVASCDRVGTWLTGDCELLRPDGVTVRVRFGTVRLETGLLAVRFEPRSAQREHEHDPEPREVLNAWRQQELTIAAMPPRTQEQLFAELEALWLGAEYRRLAIARANSNRGDS